jgi:hypothetical protein
MILFNILIQQQGTRLVTCLICLSILSVSYVFLICRFHLYVSSVCLILPSHLSILLHLSVFSICLIILLHLFVSSACLVFFLVCLVLSISLIAYCSTVSLFCLFNLSTSSVWFTVSAVCHTVYHMPFFLSVCLSFFPVFLSIWLTLICLHSLCMSFFIYTGLSRILPISRKILI